MNRPLAIFLISSLAAHGQAPPERPPRAVQVVEDPVLQPNPGNDLFARGKLLYDQALKSTDLASRKAQFERASEIFARYITDHPNHENTEAAWWYIGNSYYQSGQPDDAKRSFHTLLNRYGKGVWAGLAAFTLAKDHANKGEFAFAAPLFERYAANAARPEEIPRGHYLAAECYRRLGRDRDASTNYRKVIDNPAGALYAPQSKIALGHIAVKTGKLEDALSLFGEVVSGPHLAKIRGEAALQGALVATKLKQPEVADEYLRLILFTDGMEDFRPDAQTALMANHFAKEEYQEVIRIYRRSTLKATGETEAQRLMIAAQSHYRLEEPEAARVLFREVESLVPPEHDLAFKASYYRLLCSFQIEGRHMIDQVDAFLQIYRSSRPNDLHIHTALMMKAETLFSEGNVAAAAKVYSDIDATVVSDKNRPGLLFKRGWCLAEAGDAPGAIRSFSDFLTRYPDDERRFRALAKRATCYAETGEGAKAITDFDRLLAAGVPTDLAAFAWLESARLRLNENNISDMVVRYKGLLQNVENLDNALRGEANFRIGWGLMKSNSAEEAIPFLEAARELRPETYEKHAGLALILGYYNAQDARRLTEEIELAIEKGYSSDVQDQAIQWAGMQAYSAGNYGAAARFLNRVANLEEPRETAKGIWRFLAKAALQTGDYKTALAAATNVLDVEDNAGWKADALSDRGRALFELGRDEEARKAADEGLGLRPPPRTTAQLRILSGDLLFRQGNAAGAASEFLLAALSNDPEYKPLALWKTEAAYEKLGDHAEAETYRSQRLAEFPDWKAPEAR